MTFPLCSIICIWCWWTTYIDRFVLLYKRTCSNYTVISCVMIVEYALINRSCGLRNMYFLGIQGLPQLFILIKEKHDRYNVIKDIY